MKKEFLDIVNENDEVIGKELREKIHKEGLLHREVHVWFVTPNNEIIFQHRAKDKDLFPDLLDMTVGGHVDSGASYEESTLKELEEETGIKEKIENLIFVNKIKIKTLDEKTGLINYAFGVHYLYILKDKIDNLNIEKGKATGFESWKIDKILNLNEEERKKFIPGLCNPKILELIKDFKKFIWLKL